MFVAFAGFSCHLSKEQYSNGRTALGLFTTEEGHPELVAVASVNLPDEVLAENEVFIKNYSENKGILDALVKAGAVSPTGRQVAVGHALVDVCRVLV